ncbi:MAG: hypothetical protein MR270_02755 [Erysipelotrichaceae bacterium]|nr:hypothetical protein [Erysipelotrichaceae bacterium]
MQKEIHLNVTMNNKTTTLDLPVDENMLFIDFFISLQSLLKSYNTSNLKITTFDVYTVSFERIAMVGDDYELFIDPSFASIQTISDLLNKNIDTIEVIGLGDRSVKKVLEEEMWLMKSLNIK